MPSEKRSADEIAQKLAKGGDSFKLNPQCHAVFVGNAWKCSADCRYQHPLLCAEAYDERLGRDPVSRKLDEMEEAILMLRRAQHHLALAPNQPEKQDWRMFARDATVRLAKLLADVEVDVLYYYREKYGAWRAPWWKRLFSRKGN